MNPYYELQRAGYYVRRLPNDRLKITPKMTAEWREFAKKHKAELLAFVKMTKPKPKPTPKTNIKSSNLVQITVPKHTGGVGTELTEIMPTAAKLWAALTPGGCGCGSYAKNMDSWGIEKCEKSKNQEIENHLVSKSPPVIRSLESTRDKAKELLSTAIANAKTSESEHYAKLLCVNPIVELPDDVMVVTACDDRYIAGATLMIWTLLQKNKVKVRCYDLGISDGPMKDQLIRWGVEITQPDSTKFPIPRGIAGWQIFNKPAYIKQTLNDTESVVWLDADTAIGGDISPLIATDGILIPDHGGHDASENATRQPLIELWGPDKSQWLVSKFPCAGVIGLSRSHRKLLCHWIGRTIQAFNAEVHQHAQYFDQTILQTVLECELIDGSVYSNFSCPRHGSQSVVLEHVTRYQNNRVVHHFGGNKKPFMDWGQFVWTTPRGAS